MPGDVYRADWLIHSAEVLHVLERLKAGEPPIWVVGPAGSGKTAVLAEIARRFPGPVVGPIPFRNGVNADQLNDHALLDPAERERTVVLLDGWDESPDPVSSRQAVVRLLEEQRLRVVITSRLPAPADASAAIQLRNPSSPELAAFLERALPDALRLGPPLDAATWDWAIEFARLIGLGDDQETDDIAIVDHSGVLGPDGSSLARGDAEYEQHVVRIRQVSEELLRELRDHPDRMYSIDPRKLEEVVAELLHRQGYEVDLTPSVADGGFDVRAAKSDELGSFLYLVETKRYAPDRPVGVQVVRHLAGVVHAQQATAGIIVTTSHYTAPAKEFQRMIKHQMSLRELRHLQQWLRSAVR